MKLERLVNRFKSYGFKTSIEIIRKYKFPKIFGKICGVIFRYLKLQDVIIFESMNDFDMNGGQLYRYLIEHGFAERYKLVWFVKNKNNSKLDENTLVFRYDQYSIIKEYYNNIAKFIFYDNCLIDKKKDEQKLIYCGHATRAMKDCRGLVIQPDNVDYMISSSHFNDDLMSEVYGCDIKKFIVTGFPVTDLLLNHANNMNSGIKTIVWMPTFRKSNQVSWRDDSLLVTETGLPIIENNSQINILEKVLSKNSANLLIKLHPAQDINQLRINNTKHIRLITPNDIKDMGIDTYELLAKSSALISDYSSVSFDYLLLDRPIAYVLSDYEQYKLGFAVDNPKEYMPGDYLYAFDDFVEFINKVAAGIDDHKVERNELKDKIHTFQDGKSCERIVNFLGL